MKDLTTLVYVFDDALSESHLDDYTQAVMLRSMWQMAGRGLLTLRSVESLADRRERIQQQAVMLRSMWHMAGRGLLTLGSVESLADRRERIQQRWDARLLQRLNQHTAPAKGSPRRPGIL